MPYTFDTTAPLNAIFAQLQAFETAGYIQKVYLGVPTSYTNRASAYVALGPMAVRDKATGGFVEMELRYFIGVSYRTAGAETQAELDISNFIDQITNWFYGTNRTLNGTCEVAHLDFALARSPRYEVSAGLEVRTYPMEIVAYQRRSNVP
jgi:hypothetical protein